MLRRLSDRARVEGMLALRKALDGVRGHGAADPESDVFVRAASSERRDIDESTWWRRAETERGMAARDAFEPGATIGNSSVALSTERDAELTKALDRIADSIERVAVQLDGYHQERAEHLDAIEFLLREMVIGSVPSSAAKPVVLGGVIDPEMINLSGREITIVADGYPLEVDVAVEVRSRFHDRWIGGFAIADAVETGDRCRYRLTRCSDGIPLPILFDACDVRATTAAFEKQRVAD